MKYPTPEADAFDELCKGVGVRPMDAIPIIKKLEIKLAQKRQAHDVTRHALKLKSAECIRANKASDASINWISVADKLPDDERLVLVADTKNDVMFGFLDPDSYWRYDTAEKVVDPVTHWAEIPEPPQKINASYKCSECDYRASSVVKVLTHKTRAH